MTLKLIVETSVMAIGGLISLYALYKAIRDRKRDVQAVEAKVGIDKGQQAKIASDIAVDSEGIYLKRVAGFQDDVAHLRNQLEDSRKDSVLFLRHARILEEFFLGSGPHAVYDLATIRLLERHGVTPLKFPSWLAYLDKKLKEYEDG